MYIFFQNYNCLQQISMNENEKKKYKTKETKTNYLDKIPSKDQNKVLHKLYVEEDNIKICCGNESGVSTHKVDDKMMIGIRNNNNNSGMIS